MSKLIMHLYYFNTLTSKVLSDWSFLGALITVLVNLAMTGSSNKYKDALGLNLDHHKKQFLCCQYAHSYRSIELYSCAK